MKQLNLLLPIALLLLTFSCSNDDNDKPRSEYSGADLTKDFSITRDKKTKEAFLNVTTAQAWTLYSETNKKSIADGSTAGVIPLDVSTEVHTIFMVETSNGKALFAERHLPMTGTYNFRDIGGYKTQDGKYTKWGTLIRADELAKLTDDDLKYLESFPLRTVVDFRSDSEIEAAKDVLPSTVKNSYQFKIEQKDPLTMGDPRKMTKEDFQKFSKDITVDLVENEAAIAEFKNFFAVLQSDNTTPLLYHCTAGKDRTGVSSALILYSLGVDKETIYADYLLSNDYVMEKYAGYIKILPNLKYAFELQREYLEAAFDSIEQNYGSIDNFLTNALDVDIQKMRSKYLY